jgi:hypothetical protein
MAQRLSPLRACSTFAPRKREEANLLVFIYFVNRYLQSALLPKCRVQKSHKAFEIKNALETDKGA